MKAEDHDQIFSTVSHLPHLLAFGLVNLINNKKNKDILLISDLVDLEISQELRQATPEVWRDISIQNQESIVRDLKLFQTEISKLTSFIETKDQKKLEEYLKLLEHKAKLDRRKLSETKKTNSIIERQWENLSTWLKKYYQ